MVRKAIDGSWMRAAEFKGYLWYEKFQNDEEKMQAHRMVEERFVPHSAEVVTVPMSFFRERE